MSECVCVFCVCVCVCVCVCGWVGGWVGVRARARVLCFRCSRVNICLCEDQVSPVAALKGISHGVVYVHLCMHARARVCTCV